MDLTKLTTALIEARPHLSDQDAWIVFMTQTVPMTVDLMMRSIEADGFDRQVHTEGVVEAMRQKAIDAAHQGNRCTKEPDPRDRSRQCILEEGHQSHQCTDGVFEW